MNRSLSGPRLRIYYRVLARDARRRVMRRERQITHCISHTDKRCFDYTLRGMSPARDTLPLQ
jgi:hypothetical protein